MKHVLAVLILGAMAAPLALPHDASKHKGKAIEGEIQTVSGDKFEIKGAAGSITVSLTAKTKIEHGTTIVDRSHLKPGQRVSVFGTKLPSGEVVAREIVIAPAGGQEDHHKAGTTKKAK